MLSLAQRGETALEMYAYEDPHTPVDVFEGHTDVVKEFVWRKGGQGLSLPNRIWAPPHIDFPQKMNSSSSLGQKIEHFASGL